MSKKIISLTILAVIVIMVIGALVFFNKTANAPKLGQSKASKQHTINTVNACDVLTKDIAKQFLKEEPELGSDTASSQSSDDIKVSSCTYSTKFVIGQPSSLKTISLLVRSPKTQTGFDDNLQGFEDQKLSGDEEVSDYGDKAYWSPQNGQLNILKGGNWVIVTAGNITPASRDLSITKQAVELFKNNIK